MTSPAPIDRRSLLATCGALTVVAATGLAGPAGARGFEVQMSDSQWRSKLGPDRYRVLRQAGTERPYTSPLNKEKRKGIYSCAGCALPLFSSAAKYDSGTGWPSFWKALPKAIGTRSDRELGMLRIEEHCRRCGGHLGHIFDDGPPPTGKRHCVNGLALNFQAT